MQRADRAASPKEPVALAVTVAAGVVAAVLPSGWPRTAALLVAGTLALTAIGHARARRRVATPMAVWLGAAAVGPTAARVLGHHADALGGLAAVGGALLATVAAAGVLRRRGHDHPRELAVDALLVGLGAWLVTWATLVRPLVDTSGSSAWSAIRIGVAVPVWAVAAFLLATALGHHTQRPAPLRRLAVGTGTALGAELCAALVQAGRLDGSAGHLAERLAAALTVAGLLLLATAVASPGIGEVHRPQPPVHRQPFGRLVVVVAALVVPVIALAATSTHGTLDTALRAGLTTLLALIATARVAQAVRASHRAHAALLHGVQTDPLSGLPSRSVLVQAIDDLLRGSWTQDRHPTIFYIDLDRFKNINDSLGHAAGDEVLMTVAQRLVAVAPDDATVARISGDEYVVLHPTTPSAAAGMAFAERLLELFREPLSLSKGDVFVTASIGVAAVSTTSAASADDLVRHADTAMYRAKDAGRNCIAVYDESMHERVAHRLAIETALYRALDRRELRLFHQPILDLPSGDVVGFEALMRWQQADGTMVPPVEFIPIAEDTGTIVSIGAWALLEALTQLRQWIDDGVCSPTATMSVNVSPRQLADPNFPAVVSEAVHRSGVAPQLLWLEVTESVMITEPEIALATLRKLRSLGVRMALDDFGTGYSSLSLLQKFPLQRLKIDRAFVQGVADNPNDRSLVRTIIAMGRSLGLDLVAEGVESVHQLQVLSDLGCTKAQGFLISHPVPADAVRSTVAALERLGQFPGLRIDPDDAPAPR